jgi:hypothetical protein
MATATRELRLVEALIEFAPPDRRMLWDWFARTLHRDQPNIAVADSSIPVPAQLLERMDLVKVAADPVVSTAWKARTMLHLCRELEVELFRRGAAGEISATYYDSATGQRLPVLPEHWKGRPRSELGDVFMFDRGERQGLDSGRFYELDMSLFTLEPPDQHLDLQRNALLPWPGLILPDLLFPVKDDVRNPPPIRTEDPVFAYIAPKAADWLAHNGPPNSHATQQAFNKFYRDLVERYRDKAEGTKPFSVRHLNRKAAAVVRDYVDKQPMV